MPILFAPALMLAGCAPSPQEVALSSQRAVATTAPLVARCKVEFVKSLGALPVTFADGPSITNFGDAISIRLEAQPTNPNIIDAKIYSCDFENGEMTHHGPA